MIITAVVTGSKTESTCEHPQSPTSKLRVGMLATSRVVINQSFINRQIRRSRRRIFLY